MSRRVNRKIPETIPVASNPPEQKRLCVFIISNPKRVLTFDLFSRSFSRNPQPATRNPNDHPPLNTGFLFSRKARAASAWSAVSERRDICEEI